MYTSLLILLPCTYAVLMSNVLIVQPLLSMMLRTSFNPSDEQVGASFAIPASFSLNPRATNLAFHISSLFLIFLLIIQRVSTMLLLSFISSLFTSSKTPFSFQLSNSLIYSPPYRLLKYTSSPISSTLSSSASPLPFSLSTTSSSSLILSIVLSISSSLSFSSFSSVISLKLSSSLKSIHSLLLSV